MYVAIAMSMTELLILLCLQVVAATREHFNCPDVSGAMIENEGGVLAQR